MARFPGWSANISTEGCQSISRERIGLVWETWPIRKRPCSACNGLDSTRMRVCGQYEPYPVDRSAINFLSLITNHFGRNRVANEHRGCHFHLPNRDKPHETS